METPSFKLSMLDDPAFAQFTKTIEEHGKADPVTPLFNAGEAFVNCEILHRRAERAKKLKMPKAEYYEEMAMLHNTHGLRRLRNAKAAMKKATEMLTPGLEKKASEEEMKEILDENEMMFKNDLFEKDLSPEETEEIWAEYRKARKALDDKGPKGLLEQLGSNIDGLMEARTDLSKGRRRASPLPWWKIVLVAVTLAVAIFAVIICFVYGGCTWALAALQVCDKVLYAIVFLGC